MSNLTKSSYLQAVKGMESTLDSEKEISLVDKSDPVKRILVRPQENKSTDPNNVNSKASVKLLGLLRGNVTSAEKSTPVEKDTFYDNFDTTVEKKKKAFQKKTNIPKITSDTIPVISQNISFFPIVEVMIIGKNSIKMSGKLWNYLEVLFTKLDTAKFMGYFKKTMSMFVEFKSNLLTEQKDIADYFRRCQLLGMLQTIAILNGSLSESVESSGLIKIGPSKDNKKNCTIIDDSTVNDDDTNEIRDSKGTVDEPHRGYLLFKNLSNDQKNDTMSVFDNMFSVLCHLMSRIKSGHYKKFDPIERLQKIIEYCVENNLTNVINSIAWEVHDAPYTLTLKEKINLFQDTANLYKLWNDGFITDNHGKFRIFILGMYYEELEKM